MNELIKAVLEARYPDNLHHPDVREALILSSENLINYFIDIAKSQGYELVKVGDGVDMEVIEALEGKYHQQDMCTIMDILSEAYAIGQAKMGEVMEWASGNGWRYWDGYGWERNFNGEYITTAELIEQYQNRKV